MGCDHYTGDWYVVIDNISIHAPIVGCDFKSILCHWLLDISIHAPIVGCDI